VTCFLQALIVKALDAFPVRVTKRTQTAASDSKKKQTLEELKGILAYTDEPIVSSDLNHSPSSAIVDGLSTMTSGNLAKVLAWYDNEWGFSCRMVEVIELITEKGVEDHLTFLSYFFFFLNY